MADTNSTPINRTIRPGREFVVRPGGSQWTRQLDRRTGEPSGEWKPVEAPVAEESKPATLQLSVVVENQAEGEPKHWSLFCHRPDASGRGRGQVWQVTGDAECMQYYHEPDGDALSSISFAWHQVLHSNLSDSQFATADRIAKSTPPPRAANRAAVKENCQGWVINVLCRLVQEGIVEQRAVTVLQGHMDPI
ncbi:hypothetical protein RJ55_04737 [Drechmeria coniospora]|nr:hypothetical protein RJ55_04737 [Drechmeria coniospora]